MKQSIDFKSIWFNTKKALYVTMVLALVLSLPVLSWIELSHKEDEPANTSLVTKTNNQTTKTTNVVVFQKQS